MDLYLLLAEFSVCTVNYGPSIFPSIYGPSAKREGHKSIENKTPKVVSVDALVYGSIMGFYLNLEKLGKPERRAFLLPPYPPPLLTPATQAKFMLSVVARMELNLF